MKYIYAAILTSIMAFSTTAKAQDSNPGDDPNFYFSFTGTHSSLITGEIFGLTNNASSNPSEVVIFSDEGSGNGTQTSINSGLTSDLTLTLHPSNTGNEQITVTNDQITALNPGAPIVASNTEEWTSGGTTPAYQLGLDLVDANPFGSYYFDGTDIIATSAPTFTLAATPEPSAWALGVTAVALIVVLRRRALSA